MRVVRAATDARCVLDASAILAFLQRERGYERVQSALASTALISTLNLAEVYAKVAQRATFTPHEVGARLRALGLDSVPFDEIDARATASLHLRTSGLGLSLADRACLVLGQRLGLPVSTTDRAWRRLVRIKVELIR
jgi:PIN domain nuclease of toxin-antitoxin system